MALPATFLNHLRTEGYHPRSDKHSKALSEAIVLDLMANCPKIRERANTDQLVFAHNFDLTFGHATWNTDLAIGPPSPGLDLSKAVRVGGMAIGTPISAQIAIEAKTVMTEHRKAIKNRKRDFEAHHQHVHNYDASAIAGGLVLINGSPTFRSPLRPAITVHKLPDALVAHCLGEIANISFASGTSAVGLDALSAVAVSMDNVDWAKTDWMTGKASPRPGQPLYWDAFVARLCALYTSRFG